jgi:C4-type Zn-finger protein
LESEREIMKAKTNVLETIRLTCPECGKALDTERADYDPPNAVSMEMKCEECNYGGFENIHYFDATGNEVSGDPETFRSA